ncbi:class I SAM-dependent methyltransferase [Alphaproteobacteria bacterium]|nr:class I SAM-dependent methyltransferase [Alphaproteobacteria bacterium]
MERQEGTSLNDIRYDHKQRYLLALELIKKNNFKHITDIACGVGYGSFIMSHIKTIEIDAIEINKDAINKAKKFFNNERINLVVCFEFLEHTYKHEDLFKIISNITDTLLISSPNENVRPRLQEPINPFHVKHWKPEELETKLKEYNFIVKNWFCQKNSASPMRYGFNGKFMIAHCEKI